MLSWIDWNVAWRFAVPRVPPPPPPPPPPPSSPPPPPQPASASITIDNFQEDNFAEDNFAERRNPKGAMDRVMELSLFELGVTSSDGIEFRARTRKVQIG